MLDSLRQGWRGADSDLDRLIKRYCLASCRRIWRLLPDKASRRGVKVAELWLEGAATQEEFDRASWNAEGAYFGIQYRVYLPKLIRWEREVENITPEVLSSITGAPQLDESIPVRDLLALAAYLAFTATCYHGAEALRPYPLFKSFLSPVLLREHVRLHKPAEF